MGRSCRRLGLLPLSVACSSSQLSQKFPRLGKHCGRRPVDTVFVSVGEEDDAVEQCLANRMEHCRQIEISRLCQGLSHFLQHHQQRKTRVELAGDRRIAPPVPNRKHGGRPLSGAEAIESLATFIAERLAFYVN